MGSPQSISAACPKTTRSWGKAWIQLWELQADPGTVHMECQMTDTLWLFYLGYPSAAAKSLQSYPTLCDPRDGSPPGSPIPGILQARSLECVAISFSNAWKWKMKAKSLSRVRPSATPWTAAFQAPPSMGFSRQGYCLGYLMGIHQIVSKVKEVEPAILRKRTEKIFCQSNLSLQTNIGLLDHHEFESFQCLYSDETGDY